MTYKSFRNIKIKKLNYVIEYYYKIIHIFLFLTKHYYNYYIVIGI